MKYLVLLGDGMGDNPMAELGNKTPLEVARLPNLHDWAKAGEVGLVRTATPGYYPGSDVTQMAILGYEPQKYYTGRAPLEAAGLGITLNGTDVAYRCNFVTLATPGQGYAVRSLGSRVVLEDYSAGRITSAEAAELIYDLNTSLATEVIQFYAGIHYRHLMVWADGKARAVTTPPHDIMGQPVAAALPKGEGADLLKQVMEAALPVLEAHRVNRDRIQDGKKPANGIWLWGQGKVPTLPSFADRYGLTGAMITAVDLLRGLGIYAGFETINVPGATGWLDTNYQGKAEAALKALERKDLVYLHVEAPDEASHAGDVAAKIQALEDLDQFVVGTLRAGLGREDYRVLVLCDHRTPVLTRTHTDEPVPYILYDPQAPRHSGRSYTEREAEASGVYYDTAQKLLHHFLRG